MEDSIIDCSGTGTHVWSLEEHFDKERFGILVDNKEGKFDTEVKDTTTSLTI